MTNSQTPSDMISPETGLIVSGSPHVYGSTNTRDVMRDVLFALVPATVASVILYGLRAALVIAVALASAAVGEWAFQRIVRRPNTVKDLSALVTGLLLALSLPADIPLWQVMFGSVIAVVAVKGLFGGIGHNFANPAVTARVVLLISFASSTTKSVFPTLFGYAATAPDGVTSATPLAILKTGTTEGLPNLLEMFLGKRGGSLGEGCIAALLIGFAYLLIARVISWRTPVAMMGTVFVLSFVFGGWNLSYALYQVLSGGVVIGAVFMATDYVTTPTTHWGHFLFGVGCGVITVLIRLFSGGYPEGVSFSILLMNILTPYIDRLTLKKPLGGVKS